MQQCSSLHTEPGQTSEGGRLEFMDVAREAVPGRFWALWNRRHGGRVKTRVCVWVCVRMCVCGRGEELCVRSSCLYYLASLHLCHFPPLCKHFVSTQSSSPRSPHSPCSPRDSSKLSRQAASANQEHNEKVLLNLEEVKVSGRRMIFTAFKN